MLNLRPFQQAALSAIENPRVSQNHVICISPTGSGKSLIYERAAQISGRKMILITPLVALARQQHSRLKELGISVSLGAGGASENPPSSKSGAWIISPEILPFPARQAALKRWQPNFLVVDECHCLWEWGENFRPAFAEIPKLLHEHSIPRSLWLTATLPIEARHDLRRRLPCHPVEIGSFDLPHRLKLFVLKVPLRHRTEILISWIREKRGKGIIFVSTRQSAVRLSLLLTTSGKNVITYHGGMGAEERKNAEALIAAQIPDLIVATSAFGMGMDYPHLTFVALWQAPTSILSLVQTIGRVSMNPLQGGHALVFWDDDDFQLIEWTIRNSQKRKKEVEELKNFLSTYECRLSFLQRYFDQIATVKKCERCDQCLNSWQ